MDGVIGSLGATWHGLILWIPFKAKVSLGILSSGLINPFTQWRW